MMVPFLIAGHNYYEVHDIVQATYVIRLTN